MENNFYAYRIEKPGHVYEKVDDYVQDNPHKVKIIKLTKNNDTVSALMFKEPVFLSEAGGCESLAVVSVKRGYVLVGSKLFHNLNEVVKAGYEREKLTLAQKIALSIARSTEQFKDQTHEID